jgi:hypothetical protein
VKVIRCAQHSPEWFDARVGHVTGSEMAAVLNYLKRGGESTERRNYRFKIASELLTGVGQGEGYVSAAMDWGNEQEPFARGAYEVRTNSQVSQIGFVLHDTIPFFGGSPDGLVNDDGGLELKCPETTTHLKWMLDDVVPEEHRPQMFSYMALTGRRWWDFASFDPRPMDPRYHLFLKRLDWDDKRIGEIEYGVKQFLAEVHDMIERLKGINPVVQQLRKSVGLDSELGITDDDIRWAKEHVGQ